jgi:hypothetical protein
VAEPLVTKSPGRIATTPGIESYFVIDLHGRGQRRIEVRSRFRCPELMTNSARRWFRRDACLR